MAEIIYQSQETTHISFTPDELRIIDRLHLTKIMPSHHKGPMGEMVIFTNKEAFERFSLSLQVAQEREASILGENVVKILPLGNRS